MKNLKKYALFAEIVGGIGIIISIVYLAFQVSQNTANMKATNAMSYSAEMNAVRLLRVEDSELDKIVRIGQQHLDSLSEDETSRFYSYVLVRISSLENLLYMEEQGLFPDGYADALLPGYCASLSAPSYRTIWADALSSFSSERMRIFMAECYAD